MLSDQHPDAFLVQGGNVTRTLRTLLRTTDTKTKNLPGPNNARGTNQTNRGPEGYWIVSSSLKRP